MRLRPPGARALALLLAVALAACGSTERRLESANTLRHDGKPKEALAAYQALLADMGDGPLPDGSAQLRAKALQFAAEISYLELGDYAGAIAYYRRIVSLQPATPEAFAARGAIGDIYRERFNDPLAAIAQFADVAARDAPVAPAFQLKVIRAWIELKNFPQARMEAGALRERWPTSPEADEAQLLTAQAWAMDGKAEEALGAFRALVERRPKQELVARALEGQALLYSQAGRFGRALELYAQALPIHPNADAIRTAMEAVSRRRDASKPTRLGDRVEAFDYDPRTWVPPRPATGPTPGPTGVPTGGAAAAPPASSTPAPPPSPGPAAPPAPAQGPVPDPQEPRP